MKWINDLVKLFARELAAAKVRDGRLYRVTERDGSVTEPMSNRLLARAFYHCDIANTMVHDAGTDDFGDDMLDP